MDWEVGLSNQAERYLKQRHIPREDIIELVRKAIRKAFGESVALDFMALTGEWKGHYRVRTQKVRIIFSIDLDHERVSVDVVDGRDRAYKKH